MPPARQSARARPGPVRLQRPLTKAGVSGRRGRRGSAPTGREGPAAVPPRSLHTGREGHKGRRGHSPTANQAGLAMSGSAQLHSRGTKKLTRRYYKEESLSNTRRVKNSTPNLQRKLNPCSSKKSSDDTNWKSLPLQRLLIIASIIGALLCSCSVKSLGQSPPGSPPHLTTPTSLWPPQRTLATPSHQLLANSAETAGVPTRQTLKYLAEEGRKSTAITFVSINNLRHSIKQFYYFKKGLCSMLNHATILLYF